MIRALRNFLDETSGAITIFVVLLFPILMLIGGLATDVSLLNAQKRHVQSQADLAAQSAARYLPNKIRADEVAREVVLANSGTYDPIPIEAPVVTFGNFSAANGFVPESAGGTPVNAVKVLVPSTYNPLLLTPLLEDEDLQVRRDAVGLQQNVVVFTLRNSLLSVDTSESILDPLLESVLGLSLSASLVGYQGLADARVDLNDLLSLGTDVLDLGLDISALTFNDVLNASVELTSLLGLDPLGLLLAPVSASTAPSTLELGDLITLSPGLLDAHVGDVLPDVSLNAFDLVMAMLGLAGAEYPDDARVEVGLGLALDPLANIALSVGLLSPPVTAVALIGDAPPPKALIEQANVDLSVSVLDLGAIGAPTLITLDLGLGAIRAEAVPESLTCRATGAETLAEFTVTPSLADLSLSAGVLQSRIDNLISGLLSGLVSITIESEVAEGAPILGTPQRIAISHQQFESRQGVEVSLTGLIDPLLTSVTQLINGLELNVTLLGGLLGPLLNGLLNTLLNTVTNVVLVPVQALLAPLLDDIVMSLLTILGAQVLPAELFLDDYSCGSRLVQ
jgi:uncharacterized membrane protein